METQKNKSIHNDEIANHYAEMAALRGYIAAMIWLADRYRTGDGFLHLEYEGHVYLNKSVAIANILYKEAFARNPTHEAFELDVVDKLLLDLVGDTKARLDSLDAQNEMQSDITHEKELQDLTPEETSDIFSDLDSKLSSEATIALKPTLMLSNKILDQTDENFQSVFSTLKWIVNLKIDDSTRGEEIKQLPSYIDLHVLMNKMIEEHIRDDDSTTPENLGEIQEIQAKCTAIIENHKTDLSYSTQSVNTLFFRINASNDGPTTAPASPTDPSKSDTTAARSIKTMGPTRVKSLLERAYPIKEYQAFLALSPLEQAESLSGTDLKVAPAVMLRLLVQLTILQAPTPTENPEEREGEAAEEESTETATQKTENEIREQLISEMQLHFVDFLLANVGILILYTTENNIAKIVTLCEKNWPTLLDKLFIRPPNTSHTLRDRVQFFLPLLAKKLSIHDWVEITKNGNNGASQRMELSNWMCKSGIINLASENNLSYIQEHIIRHLSSKIQRGDYFYHNKAESTLENILRESQSTSGTVKLSETDSNKLQEIIIWHPKLADKLADDLNILPKIAIDVLDKIVELRPAVGIVLFENENILSRLPNNHIAKQIIKLPSKRIISFLDTESPNLDAHKTWYLAKLLQLGLSGMKNCLFEAAKSMGNPQNTSIHNDDLANHYARIAADKGLVDAMIWLADRYRTGNGFLRVKFLEHTFSERSVPTANKLCKAAFSRNPTHKDFNIKVINNLLLDLVDEIKTRFSHYDAQQHMRCDISLEGGLQALTGDVISKLSSISPEFDSISLFNDRREEELRSAPGKEIAEQSMENLQTAYSTLDWIVNLKIDDSARGKEIKQLQPYIELHVLMIQMIQKYIAEPEQTTTSKNKNKTEATLKRCMELSKNYEDLENHDPILAGWVHAIETFAEKPEEGTSSGKAAKTNESLGGLPTQNGGPQAPPEATESTLDGVTEGKSGQSSTQQR